MLRERLAAALVLIPLLVAALFYLPQWAWAVLMGGVVLLAAHEWARLSSFDAGAERLYLVITVLLLAVAYWLLETGAGLSWWLAGLATAFWLVVAPLWLATGFAGQGRLLRAVVGWLLLLPPWVATLELRLMGPGLTLFALGLIWLADSAAYFIGHAFGRHKLAPRVSPGKTWEGVAGGVGAALLLAWIVAATAPNFLLAGRTVAVPAFVLACAAVAAISVLGDLFESHIKRLKGVKDSSHLIPGHGGVLDRIDSLTSALPVFLLLSLLVNRLGGQP
jgi:phosphatidate cytidylyltransferase